MTIHRFKYCCVNVGAVSKLAGASVSVSAFAPAVYVDLETDGDLKDLQAAMGSEGYAFVESAPTITPLAQVKLDLGIA